MRAQPADRVGGVLRVTLGYELISRPVSYLGAYLMPDQSYCGDHPGECGVGTAGAAQAVIAAGEGEVTLLMPLESWNVRGRLVLLVGIGTTSDLQLFERYSWAGR